jgi:hypothetical protein
MSPAWLPSLSPDDIIIDPDEPPPSPPEVPLDIKISPPPDEVDRDPLEPDSNVMSD